MTDTLKPRDAKDVEEAVRWALDHDKAFELVGTGTKRAIGRPSQTEFTLDLSALSGVTLYEHDELVLSAKAGTPLAEINALIAERGQELAFEPINYGRLLGSAAAGGTIGGALAANLSGPRRIKAGAARDHFLGLTAVTGRAETIKSGGRVVKNVTGYDVSKLVTGAFVLGRALARGTGRREHVGLVCGAHLPQRCGQSKRQVRLRAARRELPIGLRLTERKRRELAS